MSKLIPILYEDECFIVFDKPAGLLVIPAPQNEKNTLIDIINEQYAVVGSWRLWPCHRIDKETSGAILFAKGKKNQKLMADVFKQRLVSKKYVAFVHGSFKKVSGEFCSSVRNIERVKFKKKLPAQSAITQYKVLRQEKLFSIMEVHPITGRTNQIRIHFSQNKHPLLGDRKYSIVRNYPLKFRRTALHAASLEWKHPVTHKKIKVQSQLPKDMEDFSGNSRDAKYRNNRS